MSQRRLFKLCETLQTRKNILYPSPLFKSANVTQNYSFHCVKNIVRLSQFVGLRCDLTPYFTELKTDSTHSDFETRGQDEKVKQIPVFYRLHLLLFVGCNNNRLMAAAVAVFRQSTKQLICRPFGGSVRSVRQRAANWGSAGLVRHFSTSEGTLISPAI